jgi:flagellar protein FlaF
MGFDSIATAILMSAVVLTAAYVFISGNSYLAEETMESYREYTHASLQRLHSNIEILSVNYESPTLIAYFKNVGSTKFEDFSSFDVIIYGKSESGVYVSGYLMANFEIVKELINPGIFDPQETARAAVSISLPNGNYSLLICTPNAICDSFEFYVGGG